MATLARLIRNSLTQTDGSPSDSCWSPRGIANSTSFSDFSLGTAGEAESVMGETPETSPTSSAASSAPRPFDRRMSCDYPAVPSHQKQREGLRLLRSSFDSRSLLWGNSSGQAHGAAAAEEPSSPVTARSSGVPPAAPPTPPKPIHKQRKIDGLDFYEYVELIRSSSL